MAKNDKKLGLGSVVSISVGLVIATSCLVSLGQGAGTIGVVFIGAMIFACLLNMTTVASLSELNALMPNTTGGLAQYTLASMGPFPTLISMVGGYLLCNILSSGVEASIFSYAMAETIPLPIPSIAYTFGHDCYSHDRQFVWSGYVCENPKSGCFSARWFHGCYGSNRNVGTWNRTHGTSASFDGK